MDIFKLLILIFSVTLQLTRSQFTPQVSLHSSNGCNGQYIAFQTGQSVASLSAYGFNDQANSVFIRGPWIFYELENYNQGIAPMEYIFEPIGKCINLQILAGHASSFRSVGHINDYSRPSVTFYATIDFQGNSEYISNDSNNLFSFGNQRSLILNGQEPWTLYDMPFYNGNTLCLVPEPSNVFAPSLIPNFLNFNPPIPIGSIASVRRGCWSKNIVKFI